ncbi:MULTISPECIES: tape measure protein [Acinetobacter]|uniref:tape measure protein n=1 Tax=Acinetobacter TaxID=469 RepID=UPI00257E57B9|nr:tape measure protein [Acinetobacter sp. UBA5984]
MSGKNLTFKLIMDADTKSFVGNIKQSEDAAKSVFNAIKQESELLKQATTDASKEMGNIIPKGTSELADKLSQSLNAATGIIKDAGDNAKSTAGNFTDFGNKAEKALDQLKGDLAQAKQNLEAFSKTKASPADIEKAQVEVDQLEKEVQQADQAFNGFQAEVNKANTSLENTDTAAQTAQKGIGALKTGYTALIGVMGGIGIGLGIRELAQAADSYTNLSARINIATSEGGNFTQAMAGVHQVSLMTNTSLDATAGLFTKVNDVGKQMGMTQQQSLDLVKTINMAIQTGGGDAAASEAAIVQLTQALQSGVLRGDEFNSIMEQAPGISKALAQSLGVTTGELRKMAENGELSAEKVIQALQQQSTAIEADYAKFPTTIGNALQRIATQWQILIGTMDQANGASATVAQWLVTLADNMDVIETILEDIGEGFIWVGDQLKKIDPATIEALKEALSTAYETVKSMASTIGTGIGNTVDQLNTLLGAIFNFDSGIDTATDKTNGFTKALQALNVVFGFIGDGFEAISIVSNLLAGVFYDVGAAWEGFKSKLKWGDAKDQAIADMEAMAKKAQEYYDRASNGATDFKSKGIAAIQEIGKTQDQKNQESLQKSNATFAELIKQDQEFLLKSKELAGERAAINAQLNQARKDGNQSTIDSIIQKSNELEGREKEHAANKAALDKDMLASAQAYAEAAIKANGGVMDGVMQSDLLTKGYIVTIDEAGKVSVQAGQSAEQAAESAAKKEEALKLAKENVKKADEEYLAYQKQAAVERALLEQQIEQAKKSGDLNALASAQASITAINAKEAELANNRDLRIAELNKANTGSGQVAETAYSRASAAAKLFGVDLDVSLNKVSKSFSSSGNELDGLKTKLGEAGYTGKQAGDVLYQAWEEWLSKAKSQAEIDAANAKMREFEAQGVFSTKQVELGITAIKRATSELPDALDETGKAFERLGIKTKEQLRLSAQMALADFETVRQSGQATQADLQKAYEKTIQLAYASGDAQSIAAANAKAASLGLSIQVSETGQVSVKANNAVEESLHRVRNATGNAGDGFDDLGRRGVASGNATRDAWEEARLAAAAAADAANSVTERGMAGRKSRTEYTLEGVKQELRSKGYTDEKEINRKANELFNASASTRKNALMQYQYEAGKNIPGFALDFKAVNLMAANNKDYIDLMLQKMSPSVGKTGSSNLNDYAPSIPSTPSVRDTNQPAKEVTYNFDFNGKQMKFSGPAGQESLMNELVNQLKVQARST